MMDLSKFTLNKKIFSRIVTLGYKLSILLLNFIDWILYYSAVNFFFINLNFSNKNCAYIISNSNKLPFFV